MRRIIASILLCALPFAAAAVARGAGTAEAEAVRQVITQPQVSTDLFAASFLAQVPASQLTSIRNQVVGPLGTFQRLDGSDGKYTAYFTRGTMQVLIHLDDSGKIDSLLFRNVEISGGSIDEALKPFRDLPGEVSYLVLQDGKSIAAQNDTMALGVGSTFKLAVLNALRKQIDSGKRSWSDVVKLNEQWKSLPSGVLQTWPAGTPLTLATLASEMISISDNTAADSLVHITGQKSLAEFAGSNMPFLTTRQMFLLKAKSNVALRAAYRAGTPAQRAHVLAQLDKQQLPDVDDVDTSPALSDIEWHFSNRDLCKLMKGVADLPLMSINPGVASASQWKRVAYKGGSDFGVLSLTTWLESKSGKAYCVSATWNNAKAPLDENTFEGAYAALVGALAGMK